MLSEAEAGILFHAPENVIAEFPQFPAVHTYETGIIPGHSNRCKCKLDRANPGNDIAIFYTNLINYKLCITEESRISTYKNDDFIAFTQ